MPPKDRTLLNKAKLLVGWRAWQNWKELRISRSIEAAASDFIFSCTLHPKMEMPDFKIFPGEPCSVSIGEDLLLTGHVDDVSQSYDAHHRTVSISGRSLTADLIDCSAREVPGDLRIVNLHDIASKLAEPYRVPVRSEVDTGPDIPLFKVHPGESVHAAVERHARAFGIIVTDDEKGALVLTRAGAHRSPTKLVLGQNVLNADAHFSHRERYSDYVVKGQRMGDDEATDVSEFAHAEGASSDIGVRRYRRLMLVGDSPGGSEEQRRRAQWEASTRAGRSLSVRYTVQGWRGAKNELWRPNTLVKVEDEWLGIDRELLLVACTYKLSDNGTITELQLAPKETYELQPEVTAAAGAGYAIERPAETVPQPFKRR
jgi:prophage tail gpP-like protein